MALRERIQPLAPPAPQLLNRVPAHQAAQPRTALPAVARIISTVESATTVKSALTVVGEFPRELGSSRGEALQGCVCWRSPRGFSTWAAVDSGIANEYADECLTYRPAASAAQGRCVSSR
jgi:hypothetical protein